MPLSTVLQASVVKTSAFNGAAVRIPTATAPFYWDVTISSMTSPTAAVFALQASTDAFPALPFASDVRTVGLHDVWGPVNVNAPMGRPPLHDYDMPSLAELVSAAALTAIAAPGTVTPTPSTSGGTLADGTYFWKVTAYNAAGETTGSPEATATTTGGGTSSVALAWTAVTGASGYRIYRGTSTGAESLFFNSATNSFTDVGAAGTAGTVPVSNGSGSKALALRVALLSIDGSSSVTYSSNFWQS